jgi:predicted Zn finger-like uncharacterized protein
MSLITRCTRCQTSFRVVQDQLRISEGWVRCGRCGEIFDASAALLRTDAIRDAGSVLRELDNAPVDDAMPISLIEPLRRFSADGPQEMPALPLESGAPDALADAAPAHGDGLEMSSAVVRPFMPPLDDGVLVQEPVPGGATETAADLPIPPSFLREMPKRSAWHRGWVRGLLAVVTLVLLMVLLVQVVVQERDRIVAMFPQLRPAVEWVCGQAGCSVGPLRRIEAVVIEGSSFSKTRGDGYRLSLVVKNMSALEIALPALELTLTDSQDQAVMRRVFTPSDLGVTNALIKAGGEWSGSISLVVRPAGGAERFSGYRVLAFYP